MSRPSDVEYCKKKSVDFTVNTRHLAANYFFGRLLVEHFQKSRYGRVMLTDNTRKYLCMVEGLYDQKHYMSFAILLCLIPGNVYRRL